MGRFHCCRRTWLCALAALAACVVGLAPAHAAQSYTYDENGNVQSITTDQGTRTYTYDEVDRLDTEAGAGGVRDHAYDKNGNRTTDGAGSAATYAPNSDRLATINGQSVTLDAAGNLIGDGSYAYTWDGAGRLKTVSQGTSLLATYFYDYRNRRTRKETTAAAPQGTGVVVYHYDQWDRLIGETRGDGTPLRTYAWQEEQPLAVIEHAAVSSPERILYLELDQLGTPRKAKDASGKVHWRWDSDGYGSTPANEDPDGDGLKTTINLRFPGQYYDRESGLHYNWNRYYSPRLGRYISSDPIGLEGGDNQYGYALANPISYTDPTGEIPAAVAVCLACPECCAAVAATVVVAANICMAENNKATRKKIQGLEEQIAEHERKIENEPDCDAVCHWKKEIQAWKDRIERLKKRLPGGGS
jgi:RHS repeat-associated protein